MAISKKNTPNIFTDVTGYNFFSVPPVLGPLKYILT